MAFRDDRHRGRAPPPPALSTALTRFYALRFAVTAMTMLSTVLLPWLVWSATKRIDLAGLVMLVEAAVRLTMSLYGGQLAHATGGRVSFAGAQALCAAGFALFAAVIVVHPSSLPLDPRAAGRGDRSSCNPASRSATSSPRRARSRCCSPARPTSRRACASSTSCRPACALPLGGWLVLAFDAPLAVIALGFALAAGAALVTARARRRLRPRERAHARALLARRPRRVALARAQSPRALADAVPARRERPGHDAVRRAAVPAREPHRRRIAGMDPADRRPVPHALQGARVDRRGADPARVGALGRRAGATARRDPRRLRRIRGFDGRADRGDSAIGPAFAAIALAASFSPLMVWVRTERAALVPEHNRQRITGLLVAVDSTAYVLGALAVRYVGFEPARARSDRDRSPRCCSCCCTSPGLRCPSRATRPPASCRRSTRSSRASRPGSPCTATSSNRGSSTRSRDSGLVKRAIAPPAGARRLPRRPSTRVAPIGVGLDADGASARAARRGPAHLVARRVDRGSRRDRSDRSPTCAPTRSRRAGTRASSPTCCPRRRTSSRAGCTAAFHRLRVDTLLRPGVPPDGGASASSAVLATRFAPLEVNNGGSQGHWICSSVNHVLLAALRPRGPPDLRRPRRAGRRCLRGLRRLARRTG